MMIFPEIDKKKTKDNARKVLKAYPKLLRLAEASDLPNITSSYTFELRQSEKGGSGSFEFILEKESRAGQELRKIAKGINKLSSFERQLLYDKFINNKETNVALYMKYHISESKFYRELDRALIHFAESYDSGRLVIEK
ncbi:ArpU family phage packaging/lysis transcriptional regulator [Enterococcus sp. LJL128]|uniref:ArpU family phage packaging/lysis transcriptional regulator n=1 Tax=Enterococcus sp. LJL51 TaxID=3416656 RepID=UPI003CF8E85E